MTGDKVQVLLIDDDEDDVRPLLGHASRAERFAQVRLVTAVKGVVEGVDVALSVERVPRRASVRSAFRVAPVAQRTSSWIPAASAESPL